jgi:hypothetical protein
MILMCSELGSACAFRARWRARERARHTAMFHWVRGIKHDRTVEFVWFSAKHTAYIFYTAPYREFHQFANVPHHTGTKHVFCSVQP